LEKTFENEIESKSELSVGLHTRIYKNLFAKALSKMKLGSMKIFDPDGTSVLYDFT
jgi:hypothetical protein